MSVPMIRRTLAGPVTLQTSTATALTADTRWTYLSASNSANDLQTAAQGLQAIPSSAGGAFVYPTAYWNAVTWPADQWVQFQFATLTNQFQMGVALRASGTSTLHFAITPNGSTIYLRYITGYAAGSSNANAFSANSSLVISPIVNTSDVWRAEVRGTGANMEFIAFRNDVQIANLGGTGLVASAQLASGNAGIMGQRPSTVTTGFITNWSAGDFVPAVQPPTPPASAKGAFTVRTT